MNQNESQETTAEREQFESYASGLPVPLSMQRFTEEAGGGAYVEFVVDLMWKGWQARAALNAQPAPTEAQDEPDWPAIVREKDRQIVAAGKSMNELRCKLAVQGEDSARLEWISVEDRLPPDGEMVLVSVRNGVASSEIDAEYYECEEARAVDFGEFKEYIGCMQCYSGPHGAFADDITHWMPLPAAPQPQEKP